MDKNDWYDAILKFVQDEDLIVTWFLVLDQMYDDGCTVRQAIDFLLDDEANW